MDQKPNPAADLQGRNAILFDFDGTVFDTVEGITKSIQHAIRKHGMDAELTELRCFAGPPLVDKFMEVFSVPETEAEQLVVDFRERYVPIGVYESEPFPGIRDLSGVVFYLQKAAHTVQPSDLFFSVSGISRRYSLHTVYRLPPWKDYGPTRIHTVRCKDRPMPIWMPLHCKPYRRFRHPLQS